MLLKKPLVFRKLFFESRLRNLKAAAKTIFVRDLFVRIQCISIGMPLKREVE